MGTGKSQWQLAQGGGHSWAGISSFVFVSFYPITCLFISKHADFPRGQFLRRLEDVGALDLLCILSSSGRPGMGPHAPQHRELRAFPVSGPALAIALPPSSVGTSFWWLSPSLYPSELLPFLSLRLRSIVGRD